MASQARANLQSRFTVISATPNSAAISLSSSPPKMLSFDNMQQRPIKGDADWKDYEVVLDVPEDAKGIFFGILLAGTGTVWMNSANFEIVGKGVPTMDSKHATPEGPQNLSFEK